MFQGIIGHTAQKAYLDQVLATDQLSHAYCFSGPANLGKMTIAREFVGIKSNVNPNATIVNGGSVEEIRDLCERLALSAFGGQRKIAIIDSAEQMTVAAQNALLKTLEEPAGQTTIILIAADATKLLPTILSRTVHVKFALVARELICKHLEVRGSPRELAHEISGFALGRPGVAINLLNPEALEQCRAQRLEASKFIDSPLAKRITQIDEIVKSSREDKARVAGFLDQIMLVLHERGVETTAKALSALLASRESLDHNGNRSLILEHVAINV
jgi:DNA polymerase-3 subunit delta'